MLTLPTRFAREVYRVDLIRQREKNSFTFRAGNVLAGAMVKTHAESEMSHGAAVYFKGRGLWPLIFIPVGRGQHAEDFGAFLNSNAAHFDVGICGSAE